ncbi:serine kinase [Frigidibacter sp. SD6-1]|uniref:HPr kinase/phosphorylase n=1 Tax=Frigidibacter sp. SD6-1 TaxID=3032581 RepID=UPI0024DF8AC6|nr:serine kinase [Frigidibacter sp. SD6-1]
MTDSRSEIIHATTVAWQRRAVVIAGPSGSGKSALALQLMAFGCTLVADDQTLLSVRSGLLHAAAPATISGRIEIRGAGIFAAEAAGRIPVTLTVDLSIDERERLPPRHVRTYLGISIPCLHRIEGAHFPAAILHVLRSERLD